jgi:hypothetical protein
VFVPLVGAPLPLPTCGVDNEVTVDGRLAGVVLDRGHLVYHQQQQRRDHGVVQPPYIRPVVEEGGKVPSIHLDTLVALPSLAGSPT